MSYCRFRNTLSDLEDCLDAIYSENMSLENPDDDDDDGLSPEEYRAKERLIKVCQEIVEAVS